MISEGDTVKTGVKATENSDLHHWNKLCFINKGREEHVRYLA